MNESCIEGLMSGNEAGAIRRLLNSETFCYLSPYCHFIFEAGTQGSKYLSSSSRLFHEYLSEVRPVSSYEGEKLWNHLLGRSLTMDMDGYYARLLLLKPNI